jgi:hypothetical protein
MTRRNRPISVELYLCRRLVQDRVYNGSEDSGADGNIDAKLRLTEPEVIELSNRETPQTILDGSTRW